MIYELAKYQSRCIDYGHAFEKQKTGVVQVLERENWWMIPEVLIINWVHFPYLKMFSRFAIKMFAAHTQTHSSD